MTSVAALVSACSDHALDVVFHQRLKNGFSHRSQETALIVLLQQINQRHVGLGHRGLHRSVVEIRNLHHTDVLDGHPGCTASAAANSTTSSDTTLFQMDFGSKPTTRAPDRLTGLSPFAWPLRHAPG